ncbi:hypothetical protein [Nostoc sp. LPT]|uniref:hypothetical protein n=1 Tax=Nostoc sp. LPT TaxID=2815387 RepID=UPI001DA57F56|nr:hypothetical protein [Nostoc sp. LPT]MBN4004247.1 hypothetical protein [Nostoc sp. LPT]
MTKTVLSHTLPPRTLQQQRAIKEDIIAFIKKAKTKKPLPKSDVCNNFDNTYKKPILPDDALQAVVFFAGGGGIGGKYSEAVTRGKIG